MLTNAGTKVQRYQGNAPVLNEPVWLIPWRLLILLKRDLTRCVVNQHHASLAEGNFTAYCYATMAPKVELIKTMKQVDQDAPNLNPNPFCPNKLPLQRQGSP